mmetsp:Transcript_48702/g.115739  ORF Transcript_48702/g.115739 Transcript_48702/m.115739 type:complete len:236 (-) Transcript_48702:111-818(-)
MARSTLAPRAILLLTSVVVLRFLGAAFVPMPSTVEQPGDIRQVSSAAPLAASAASIAALGGVAQPAFANEGSVIPLGGGFAINLDIPETGVVNIAILIAGLIYLLGPVLSESMATREKEIQQDIDDAIAKYEEATSRLAEAEKNQAQADSVIAEIEASIEKDKADFKKRIEATCENEVKAQAEAAEKEISTLNANVDLAVESYINLEAIKLGAREASKLSEKQKEKIMEKAISLL